MRAPGAPFSLEVISTSIIKPRAGGGVSNGRGGANGGGAAADTTPLSAFDTTIGKPGLRLDC